jgi:energy-coupling factor transporter ATP-binding protein EcfA2
MKELILLRGLPGSGKSTVAKILGGVHYESDMYFTNAAGEYKFDPSGLRNAHEWCQDLVWANMEKSEPLIVVSNTFTQEWETEAYYKLAENHGYRVHSIVVENRHGGVNEHGVPADKLEQMKTRFEIKL